MGFIQSTLLKLLFSQKEQLLAMGLKMLSDAYEEHEEDLAARIIAMIPEKNRGKAHPEEMLKLLDVLQECAAKISVAVKPLFSD